MQLFKKALPSFIIIIFSIFVFMWIGYRYGKKVNEDVFDLEMKLSGYEHLIIEIYDFVKEKYNVDVIEEMNIELTELLTNAWKAEGMEPKEIEKGINEINEYLDEFYSFIKEIRHKKKIKKEG